MAPHCGIKCADLLDSLHKAQHQQPIRDLWSPCLRLPKKLTEFVCAVCQDFPTTVREEAVLLLKRYMQQIDQAEVPPAAGMKQSNMQVIALTCANLAAKYWQQPGIPEPQLHWLSCNAFTRREFVDAEVEVLRVLQCHVHWDGSLLGEWVQFLLFLCQELLSEAQDMAIFMGVASHLIDILAFQDELRSLHWPSELAASVIQAAVFLCTKSFQRYTLCRRVSHLCRVEDCCTSALSEKILQFAIGKRETELMLEGGGSSGSEPPKALELYASDSDDKL